MACILYDYRAICARITGYIENKAGYRSEATRHRRNIFDIIHKYILVKSGYVVFLTDLL